MKLDVKNLEGKVVSSIELDDTIFNCDEKAHAVYLAAKAYLANQRQGTHATKTRSNVSGGGKKPFKQKGTGNARQGTSRAPNMPGGAVVHGPLPRSYKQYTNKKLRAAAMKSLLTNRAKSQKITVVDEFNISEFSSKAVSGYMKNLDLSSALITDERKDQFLYRSGRNLKSVDVRQASDLNVVDILRHENIVLSKNAVEVLTTRLKGGQSESV